MNILFKETDENSCNKLKSSIGGEITGKKMHSLVRWKGTKIEKITSNNQVFIN